MQSTKKPESIKSSVTLFVKPILFIVGMFALVAFLSLI